jgi:predicted transcriptional regulator
MVILKSSERVGMLEEQFSLQAEGKRRDKLVLFSAMLLRADGGAAKTELMYKVGLSSAQFDKYIPVLVGCDLLEVFNRTKRACFVYKTTAKGKKFLENFGKLVKLLDSERKHMFPIIVQRRS